MPLYVSSLNEMKGLDLIEIYQEKGCFVHNSTFVDMNLDGKLDILFAETCQTSFQDHGKLVWIEQPIDSPLSNQWIAHDLYVGTKENGYNFLHIQNRKIIGLATISQSIKTLDAKSRVLLLIFILYMHIQSSHNS